MSIKTIYGIKQLGILGAGLNENQSLPCLLVAPDLLKFAVNRVEVIIEQAKVVGSPEVTEFLPNLQEVEVFQSGLKREIVPGSGKPYYTEIVDGYIACGITRVSLDEFDATKSFVENEDFGEGVKISRFADGDLVRFFVHETQYGPGVVLDVLTEKILPDILPPRIALNPFGTEGWKYLQSLFETAAFFWAITDGKRAFILTSIRDFYPSLVQKVHNHCRQVNAGIEKQDFSLAVKEIQEHLKRWS